MSPVDLDLRRGMAAQKATVGRRERAGFKAQRRTRSEAQAALEQAMLAGPAADWPAAAERACYLIGLYGQCLDGQDLRKQQLVASVIDDLRRLSRVTDDPDRGP